MQVYTSLNTYQMGTAVFLGSRLAVNKQKTYGNQISLVKLEKYTEQIKINSQKCD
jgi:hypothetical protein